MERVGEAIHGNASQHRVTAGERPRSSVEELEKEEGEKTEGFELEGIGGG